MFKRKKNWSLIFTLLAIGLIFSPSLLGYFSGDDWAVMRVSQVNSLREFFNFFSFSLTPQSLTFFRPLPQQLFFFIFGRLFGLNPFPFYLFSLLCFLGSLHFLYHLARKLKFNDQQSLLTVIFYGVAVANFSRLYFLSAFQDVLLPLFVILSILAFLNKKDLTSILFFILALLSKETAIVLPFLILATTMYLGEKKTKRLIPHFIALAVYLILRLKYFGGADGDSYLWDFSIKKGLNTLMWYSLWSLGTPEIMVDYVGSGLKIVPKFFSDFYLWAWVILVQLGTLFLSFVLSITRSFKDLVKKKSLVIFCLFFFLISLGPVIFMPWHKFTHALSLPMIGTSLLLGYFFSKPGLFSKLFILLYLITNISMMVFLYPRFYSVNRGKISQAVHQYFSDNYPIPPKNSYFIFTNDPNGYLGGKNQSLEIAQAISQSDFFRIFYHDRNYQVYFQDLPILATPSGSPILIDSGKFLRRDK